MKNPPHRRHQALNQNGFTSLAGGSTEALLALPSARDWAVYVHQNHNEDFPDDWIDTVEDMLEHLSEFHIDEIICVNG